VIDLAVHMMVANESLLDQLQGDNGPSATKGYVLYKINAHMRAGHWTLRTYHYWKTYSQERSTP
jgi:hypothetical protein